MISSKKNFIFVHIPKTAGSSIAWALRRDFDRPNPVQRMINSIGKRTLGRQIYPKSQFQPFEVHAKATDYLTFLGDKYWTMNTFGFVRNPFDLQISLYHYIRQTPAHFQHEKYKSSSFHDFVIEEFSPPSAPFTQTSYLTDTSGNCAVRRIGRFETINDDFSSICAEFGISAELDHLNASARKKDTTAYYDEELRRLVVAKLKSDFENFGYSTNPECAEFEPMTLTANGSVAPNT